MGPSYYTNPDGNKEQRLQMIADVDGDLMKASSNKQRSHWVGRELCHEQTCTVYSEIYDPEFHHGTVFRISKETKYLHIILDSILSWRETREKEWRKLWVLCTSVRWGLLPCISQWLYSAVVWPILSYGRWHAWTSQVNWDLTACWPRGHLVPIAIEHLSRKRGC